MDERGTLSRIGAIVVAVGAVLVLAGLSVLPWFRLPSPPGFYGRFFAATKGGTHFGDVHDAINSFQQYVSAQGISRYVSFGVSHQYFGWLGWVLWLAAVGVAGVAVSPIGAAYWTPRWLAAVIAFAGGGITVTALDLVTFAGNPPPNARPPSFGQFAGQSAAAPWVVVAGYTLILAGSFAPHPAPQESPRLAGRAARPPEK